MADKKVAGCRFLQPCFRPMGGMSAEGTERRSRKNHSLGPGEA